MIEERDLRIAELEGIIEGLKGQGTEWQEEIQVQRENEIRESEQRHKEEIRRKELEIEGVQRELEETKDALESATLSIKQLEGQI